MPTPPIGVPGVGVIDAGVAPPVVVPPPPTGPVALPLIVTDHFQNRGLFGDGNISRLFARGGIFTEISTNVGLCAQRPPGARGLCLQVKYTPPPGYTPAPGGFVGVYLLTTLRADHTAEDPGARLGTANWRWEPGVPVVPGATRVSFYTASEDANATVVFKAGTRDDSAALPETKVSMTRAWTQYEMPLAGLEIGAGLLGGFTWIIKDTGRPVTFYVDDIVWDDRFERPPIMPAGRKDNIRQFVFLNKCPQTVWVGITPNGNTPPLDTAGFQLNSGATRTVVVPQGQWGGRFWGRTGCNFNAAGAGTCETGGCGNSLSCAAAGGNKPVSLLEITMNPAGGPSPDFYDLSLVDGFNLPVAMGPLPGSFTRTRGVPWDCGVPSCTTDMNARCPAGQRLAAGGRTVGCLSACEAFGTDQFCCAGAFNVPERCPPFDASRAFKAACPLAYSYAYDDGNSTFVCKGEDYGFVFCPTPGQL